MVVEEIKEGIKNAMSRGESMGQAMQTFFNSGYNKEEIEDAAKVIQMEKFSLQTQPGYVPPKQNLSSNTLSPQVNNPLKPSLSSPQLPSPQISKPKPVSIQQPIQKVSSYGERPKKSKSWGTIILLSVILFILLVVLGAVILFNKDIISFIEGMAS